MNDKRKNERSTDGRIPNGGEEERRGNDAPTHPDLMGPYPELPSTQGTVLEQEDHPDRSDQGGRSAE